MMRTTELVRHVVDEQLTNHPEVSDEEKIRSISSKIADPRLEHVSFAQSEEEEIEALANILANELVKLDWEKVSISNKKETREKIVYSVIEAYSSQNSIYIESNERDADSNDQTNNRTEDENWYIGDPADIDPSNIG